MKALLSLLTIAVAGFFGYNHAESVVASRTPVEEIDLPPAISEPVAPVPESPAPTTPATTPPEPTPVVTEEAPPAEPEPKPGASVDRAGEDLEN